MHCRRLRQAQGTMPKQNVQAIQMLHSCRLAALTVGPHSPADAEQHAADVCCGPTLSSQHSSPEEEVGLLERQEGEQVHALILSLLQQRVDPAMVALEAAQGSQVPQHGPHHAWHAWPHTTALSCRTALWQPVVTLRLPAQQA